VSEDQLESRVSKELDQYALVFKCGTPIGIDQGQRTGRRVCLVFTVHIDGSRLIAASKSS
jgi:hypothetical protein